MEEWEWSAKNVALVVFAVLGFTGIGPALLFAFIINPLLGW